MPPKFISFHLGKCGGGKWRYSTGKNASELFIYFHYHFYCIFSTYRWCVPFSFSFFSPKLIPFSSSSAFLCHRKMPLFVQLMSGEPVPFIESRSVIGLYVIILMVFEITKYTHDQKFWSNNVLKPSTHHTFPCVTAVFCTFLGQETLIFVELSIGLSSDEGWLNENLPHTVMYNVAYNMHVNNVK